MITARRTAAIAASATLGLALLAGCSSYAGPVESSSASAEPTAGAQLLPPVIIQSDQAEAQAKVGDLLDILVSDNELGAVEVTVDDPSLIEVSQAYEEEGGAAFNPGGKVLAPGTAVLTISYGDGPTRTVTVTIAE
ncbi:MAG: hypothetical protein Q7V58_11860 [Actinomycetota bacterium]|nr:hypothetical protein [Actinomycetota bacterium]